MHPEVKSTKKGRCSICGMSLEEEKSQNKSKIKQLAPLFVIIGIIFGATFLSYLRFDLPIESFMLNFMAVFLITFAAFKLLDLRGFAQAYASYDLFARKNFNYGFIYPFLELSLGLAFLLRFQLIEASIVTFILMLFSGVGVLESLLAKRKFQCACLGTVIKVPLTQVTLIEDFGMAAMAATVLFNT